MWTDPQRNIVWSFSHNAMLFRGRDLYTAEQRGWMGVNGVGDTTPFPAVPMRPRC